MLNQRLHPLAGLLIISIFLPESLSFYLGGLRLTAARLILIMLTPILLPMMIKQLNKGRYYLLPSDCFIMLAAVWMFWATSVTDGWYSALVHTSPVVLEFCCSYWAIRLLLDGPGQARLSINLLCNCIVVIALLGISDSLIDRYLVREWLGGLTGYAQIYSGGGLEHRHGILRATGAIEHPILFGLICGIGVLLFVSVNRSFYGIVLSGLGLVLSFSSGPALGTVLGVMLLVFNRVFRRSYMKWRLLIGGLLASFAALTVIVRNPFAVLLQYLMFDPSSGYDRLFQWQLVGGFLLQGSPWVGVGFVEPEEIKDQLISGTGSIDSLWLGMGLEFGIVGAALIGTAVIGTTFYPRPDERRGMLKADRDLVTPLNILMLVISFVGFTVFFWGTAWMLTAILMGIKAHLGELGRAVSYEQHKRANTLRPGAQRSVS